MHVIDQIKLLCRKVLTSSGVTCRHSKRVLFNRVYKTFKTNNKLKDVIKNGFSISHDLHDFHAGFCLINET